MMREQDPERGKDARILRVSCQKATADDFGSVNHGLIEVFACGIQTKLAKTTGHNHLLDDWPATAMKGDRGLDSDHCNFQGQVVWVVCIWRCFCLLLCPFRGGTYKRIGWLWDKESHPLVEAVHKAERRKYVIV